MTADGPPRDASRQDDLELILRIGLEINEEHDLDRLLGRTVEGIRQSLHHAHCSVLLKEGADLVIRAVTEYPEHILGQRVRVGEGLTGRCAASCRETLVPDLRLNPHFVPFTSQEYRSELDIPIVFRDRVLGVLNTQSTEVDAFGERDTSILRILAGQLGIALHHAQIRNRLKLVQAIGMQLVTIVKTSELFPWIVNQIRDRLHHDSCAILRAVGDHLVLEAATGGYASDIVGLEIPMGRGITGRCAQTKSPINVGDTRLDPEYIPAGVSGARSEAAWPILFEGELYGVLTVESSEEHAFDDDDVRLLSTLSAQVAVALHQARMFADAEQMAVTDALTGLYNYRYFYERLRSEMARSARYGHALAIIMIDLDNFKQVNDRFGHLKGDDVLREVAQALKRNTRRYDVPMAMRDADIDITSRYGGEEFIIIMPDTGAEGAAAAAERIRSAIEAQVGGRAGLRTASGETIRVTGSFGVTGFDHDEDPESVIRRADEAVYRAKAAGKNRVVVQLKSDGPAGEVKP